ncbi:retrovirus-related pol polyprotein from transposon TNT 1-94 [Tanacetum coccineum]
MIVAGAENRPPMLDKSMYNSWQSRMWLYIKGKKNGRMMLESIENGPLVYPTIEENGRIREKKYAELTEQEKLQDDYDVQATNIVLQGTKVSYQERECKLYNEFDKFTSVKGKSLYEYYLRFAQLLMICIQLTSQCIAGAENRPPMLDKSMYKSWQSRMWLYIKGKKNGRMMLESVENGPLVYPTIKENGRIREKKYAELTEQEKLQDDYDVQATNIILQGLPPDVYSLVNHSEFPQLDSGLVVPSFLPGDDPIAYLNKAMAFTVTVQQVQGRQVQSFVGTGTKGNATRSRGINAASQARVVKCYNYQGKGHMARQCTKPKRLRNYAWFKEKMLLVQA